MGMMLTVRNGSGFLRAGLSGAFSIKEAERTFLELLEAVRERRATRVLVDGRELTGKPTMLDRFDYGTFVATAVAKPAPREVLYATRFAYLLAYPMLDPGRFGETVARNRGVMVKATDDLEEALAWLGVSVSP